MTRGLAQELTLPGQAGAVSRRPPLPNKIIGVICSGDLAVHRDRVKSAIERGCAQLPDAVWVCVEPKSDRLTHDVMISLDIEPVVLPLNPYWKGERNKWGREYDERRTMRDQEMLQLCDELVIFHKATSKSPWRERKEWGAQYGLYEHLFVVELGEPARKRTTRKARKPVGV